ncbi:Host cell surface-exposed lipoprotein [Yersinia rohdei]|uniref:Ltp family lipoprotein n=1 Tax=Yersinia rohdei TaxID=29485 RepID=UPI0005E0E8C1|nr:Ltp family lipoprotein [Yersinia rohdei]CNJ08165.1 Host cell surface-exposed lipoprotein [Yersinia rohdei]
MGYGDISLDFLKIVLTAALFVAAPTWAGDMTGPQNNAVRSAEQYLSMAGFSRNGLIDQLSSDAGDGYEASDATVAVDSLNIDWNQEAVKSAKQYLSMMGFSCKGLINQLSSSDGDKYTVDQATYGAKQAGGC